MTKPDDVNQEDWDAAQKSRIEARNKAELASLISREVVLFRHLPDYLQNQVNEEIIRLEEEGE